MTEETTIDMHCHWLPEALAAALRERSAAPRIVTGGMVERLEIYGETLPFSNDYVDIPSRLDHMDRHGVDQHVLSLPGLFGIDSLRVDESVPLVQLFNDSLAALVREHGTRFRGLAALPLANIKTACAELRRAHTSLGLIGAILPADGFLTKAKAKRFQPLLELGDALGAHFFVHPGPLPRTGEETTKGVSQARLDRERVDNENQRHVSLTVQKRLTDAMVTLTMTDLLEPYRRVTVQVANLGGDLPWLLERMDQVSRRNGDPELPSRQVHESNVFVDCSSFGPRAIQMAIGTFGYERLLLGTDHPIFETRVPLAAIRRLGLDEAQRAAILGKNALSILARAA